MLPFQPQNQVRGSNNPPINQLPGSNSSVPNQFSFSNPLMPAMGEFQNQNALLSTLLVQQQLIQGLQNNLMAAISQQGVIPQFNGQQLNLLGSLQRPNMMPLQQGFLNRPPLNQNLNQAIGCPPNGFLRPQNLIFPSNSQLPVRGTANPNPVFLGNGSPQVAQSINNSTCLNTQIASQNLQAPVMPSPMQNNQFNGLPRPQMTQSQAGGQYFSNISSNKAASTAFRPKFTGSGKMEQPNTRFQKVQFQNSNNARKKEGPFPRNDNKGRPQKNERNTKLSESNYNTSMRKRPFAVIYTESEIQQWRESRKKNFPTRANIEKKLVLSSVMKEDAESDAKARRQQLQEILAKQAELGIEVAEIPSNYLTVSGEQTSRNENTSSHFNKKRGRFQKTRWNAKNHKFKNEASPSPNLAPVVKKREPSLLRKLLNADIRQEKSQLLQAFRFIVLNSFFKNSPGKPLNFPTITARDESAPNFPAVDVEMLLKNDFATELPHTDAESAIASLKKHRNGEEAESDSDDIDGGSEVACEAIGEELGAAGDKSEEGEITE